MTNLHFVNVVWGAAYTEAYVNICLPSELSAGNLQYVGAHSRSTYRIYTTPKDAETILASPAGKKLASLVDLQIARVNAALPEDNPHTDASPKYQAMSHCHTHFIKTAGNTDSPLVFLSPDLFWADGSLRRLLEIAQSGKRLLMMNALRLAKERFITTLRSRHFKNGRLQTVGKRELVALAMDHLHPDTESLVWDCGRSNRWPSLLLWKHNNDGLVLRAFHLHPLMVRPVRRDIFPEVTIDADYIERVCPDPKDEYIVCDSDDIVGFELSRETSRGELVSLAPYDAESLAGWARGNANTKHQKFVQQKIRIHSKDLSDDWQETEQRSDHILGQIQSFLVRNHCPSSK
jgi:hypothetical protein